MEKIRILHTNDLHSHFEHFPKIARYLKKAQADQTVDQVYTFDAGDFMDRSHPLSDATAGQFNVKLMNDMGYDVVTIGNNEGISNPHFDLEHLFDQANFKVVLANLKEEDGSLPRWALESTIITTKKKTKIALIGLTADYPLSYEPNHWQVQSLKSAMEAALLKLYGKYDLLILLTHVGLQFDRWLAENYSEIDLIIGGHSHDLLKYGELEEGTWITQTGKWGNYVGDIHLEIDDQHRLIQLVPKVVSTSSLPAKEEDADLIESYKKSGQHILCKQKVANLPKKFTKNYPAAIQVSLDAIADFAQTDIAILSSGLFLAPFKAGILTKYDLQKSLPHSMHVVRSTLKGKDLWRLVMEIEKNRHYLDHFPLRGMSFRGKIFGQMFYKGISFNPQTEEVLVHGKKIVPDEDYFLASLDHYVLVPFFPTLAIVGKNEFLFPQFLREVVGNYLMQKYPIQQEK